MRSAVRSTHGDPCSRDPATRRGRRLRPLCRDSASTSRCARAFGSSISSRRIAMASASASLPVRASASRRSRHAGQRRRLRCGRRAMVGERVARFASSSRRRWRERHGQDGRRRRHQRRDRDDAPSRLGHGDARRRVLSRPGQKGPDRGRFHHPLRPCAPGGRDRSRRASVAKS